MTEEETNSVKEKKPRSRRPVLVLGVGNVLMSDEGVGVRVAGVMKDMELPQNVEVLDGGTASFDLLDSLAHRQKVIIVDAIKGGSEPGAMYRFTPDDIASQTQDFISLHQVGLLETLTMAKLLGCLPQELVILGIEPKKVEWGLHLSVEIEAALPRVIELVLTELGVTMHGSPSLQWPRQWMQAYRHSSW